MTIWVQNNNHGNSENHGIFFLILVNTINVLNYSMFFMVCPNLKFHLFTNDTKMSELNTYMLYRIGITRYTPYCISYK